MADPHVVPQATGSHEATGEHLHRGLQNRHIQLIAIGGAIGTGLFMGSGKTIAAAGPSIVLVYLVIGIMVFFVMRAMGELLLHNLDYKSFQDFCADMLGPWAGFFTGWTYWLCWIVTGMADLIAVVSYYNFWIHPADPTDVQALSLVLGAATLLALLGLNLLTVALFGELEFWFALIKIVAIVALIILGGWLIITGFTAPDGTQASLANLWNRPGGVFPHGTEGFLAGFQIATFAFVGIELVGATAAETANPTTTLPRAINQIPVRILVFYVLSLVVIMSVTPWDQVNPELSPFVNLFSLIGIAAAASIMNFVVLTSAASAANSGLYSTSRMLYGLAHKGMAPAPVGRLSRRMVPAVGLIVSVIFVGSSLLLLLSDSVMEAFTVVTTISAVLFMFVWGMILVSYVVYRRRHPEAHARSIYKMPGGVPMCWVVLAFFVFILVVLTRQEDTLRALLVTPVWFVLLAVGWFAVRGRVHRDDSHTELPV
ncbi:amino acid permease [Ornithinimicrobium tianjinense]|uniref:D-serine/D-alanine/glycine transporter n=1 Tax=Ornithinimicrobium tianjinense TaxID=1195761 RepID=A0A917BKS2_9MICO|nr:amino acid permease [Ornithinimicrobium tianjinense]GGF47000.1 D-serine/D-alanine/glycine transporter [Ornithinimicrobium tianjinense]